MKLSRLWQPRRAVFWMMVVFNLLSSGLTLAMRSQPWSDGAMLFLGGLALANSLCGLWLAVRLLKGE